jgi:hypothetical protein
MAIPDKRNANMIPIIAIKRLTLLFMTCSLRVGDVKCDATRRVPLLSFGESSPMAFLCRVRYEINLCGIVAAIRLIPTVVEPASSCR